MRVHLPREDLPFQRFPERVGLWTVLSYPSGEYWPCRCDCGMEREVAKKNLRTGGSRSCGCERTKTIKERLTTHGLSRTKEYRRYYHMKNWDSYLYMKCKAGAKRQGLPFNLEKSDIVVPDVCPVLGLKLAPQVKGRSWNTPTVDRIVPHLGYTKGNVVVVSWRANRLKLNASFDEISKIYHFYVGQHLPD